MHRRRAVRRLSAAGAVLSFSCQNVEVAREHTIACVEPVDGWLARTDGCPPRDMRDACAWLARHPEAVGFGGPVSCIETRGIRISFADDDRTRECLYDRSGQLVAAVEQHAEADTCVAGPARLDRRECGTFMMAFGCPGHE